MARTVALGSQFQAFGKKHSWPGAVFFSLIRHPIYTGMMFVSLVDSGLAKLAITPAANPSLLPEQANMTRQLSWGFPACRIEVVDIDDLCHEVLRDAPYDAGLVGKFKTLSSVANSTMPFSPSMVPCKPGC